MPQNPLAGPLQLVSHGGPKPTARTRQMLYKHDLHRTQLHAPEAVLTRLEEEIAKEPSDEKMYAYAELAYIQGKKTQNKGNASRAFELYSAAVAHAYLYLFAPHMDQSRNYFDPQFRQACDVYNSGLEDMLRILNKHGRLQSGQTFTMTSGDRRLDVAIVLKGPWHADDFERFEFASDYEVKGLTNRHVTYGLGVPLLAVWSNHGGKDPASQFYPRGMSFPVTAILRAAELPCQRPGDPRVVSCALELHDPLISDQTRIANRLVPLQTDLTTPLGFFLDNPEFQISKLATWGLLDPNAANRVRGLYMLETFDPQKIPVLMVHGLWSSPETWTEMLNELRSMPEVRSRYQFWTYLYPTGQPFWISASQLRQDLTTARVTVDPQQRLSTLDQMVLVGHSMGGLVAKLQTLESGDDFWHILSDRPFDSLKADPETREKLVRTLFFDPNPSVRRLITIGTPHRGSSFANDYTRWLGRRVIKLPTMLVQTQTRIVRENPGFFRNTDVLTINTSIDSLSPDSPVLPAILEAQKAPWVKYNNIVGVVDKKDWLGRIAQTGDGVVPFTSAHLETTDAETEEVVEADHVHVHQHPRAIWEVRRLLLEHSAEMYAEMGYRATVPAAYQPSAEPAPDCGPASWRAYPLPPVETAVGDTGIGPRE
jgi:pimeloyl-ACP methyl ester carboxylesterase